MSSKSKEINQQYQADLTMSKNALMDFANIFPPALPQTFTKSSGALVKLIHERLYEIREWIIEETEKLK